MFMRAITGFSCDACNVVDETREAYLCFARGATGRVCFVMCYCADCGGQTFSSGEGSTLSEIRDWAESVPGGYLDF